MQMLVDFHDSLQENRHDTGEGGGDDGHADGAEESFSFLSCALIYGFRSSVPGIVHAFVCPTHQPSMNRRSARFRTDSMTSSCQKPVRKSLAPLTA